MSIGTFVNLLNVILLYLGYGLKELVIVNLAGSFLGIIAFYIMTKRVIPEFKLSVCFSSRDMREVFSFGLYTLFTRFSAIVSQSVNQLVVGVVLGPSGTTIINIPTKLVSRFQSFIYKVAYSVFPITSELSALKDISKIENIYLKLSRYIYMISSLFFIILIAYSKSILYFWMGDDFAQKAYLPMVILSGALFIVSLTMVPSLIAVGMGNPKYNATFSFIGTITNILLVYPLTKYFGVAGSAFSFLLGSLNSPFYIFYFNKRILGTSNRRCFLNVFLRITLMNICFFILFSLLQKIFIHNISRFCVVLSLSGVMMVGLFYLFSLFEEDRQTIKAKVIGFFRND